MGEALVIGLVGGAVGIAIGYGAAALIQALAPPLTASTADASGGPGGRLAHATRSAHTVSVHLTAPSRSARRPWRSRSPSQAP
jgi:putative ABC transport system permease protein